MVMRSPIHGHLPGTAHLPARSYPPSEALTHDWNKYKDVILAVGGVDTLIRVFDIRNLSVPVSVMEGHDYAIRRIAYSPHMSDTLLSASYDMTVRNWADGTTDGEVAALRSGVSSHGHVINRYNGHTEFVTGIDWCLFGDVGWMASTAWDQYVRVYDIRAFPVRRGNLP